MNAARPSDGSSIYREPIRLGISACLLGERVRFDDGHKRDPFLVETLGPRVEWVPVCPEVESGMAAPRESLRLVQTGTEIRLIINKTAHDHFRRCGVPYLADQVYVRPHPVELMLRNHV